MRITGWQNRFKVIAAGGASRMVTSLSPMLISLLVIRLRSPELWGSIVDYMIILDIGFSIVSWGASPFLLREFSLEPANIKRALGESISSRSVLLLTFVLSLFFLPVPSSLLPAIALWGVARFVYQAFEPLIQFERAFTLSLFAEASGLLIVIVPVVFAGADDTNSLVWLMSASAAWKALLVLLRFANRFEATKPSTTFFVAALPFLLLTSSAMLQQRADLFSVAFFLGDQQTAVYQVFINLLIFSQFGASLLLSPFAKNIFRLPRHSFRRLEQKFMLWGIVLSAASVGGVFLLITWLYQLSMSPIAYLFGYVYILCFYLYALRNYELGKAGKQVRVAMFSFAVSIANASLCAFLIPFYQVIGAIAAATVAQGILVTLYHIKK